VSVALRPTPTRSKGLGKSARLLSRFCVDMVDVTGAEEPR
jgi:hypothetical protein